MEVVEGGLMDLKVEGGDIAIVGFWWNTTVPNTIALATQDVVQRLFVNSSMSVFLNGYGVGPIDELPKESIEGAVIMAVSNSPFVEKLVSVEIKDGEADEINITIAAVTPTGETIGIDIPISGVTS